MHPLYDIYKKVLDFPTRKVDSYWGYIADKDYKDGVLMETGEPGDPNYEQNVRFNKNRAFAKWNRIYYQREVPCGPLSEIQGELLTIKDNPPRDLDAIKSERLFIPFYNCGFVLF